MRHARAPPAASGREAHACSDTLGVLAPHFFELPVFVGGIEINLGGPQCCRGVPSFSSSHGRDRCAWRGRARYAADRPDNGTARQRLGGAAARQARRHPHRDPPQGRRRRRDDHLRPGGSSGWHHHPGLVLVVVRSGTVTFYDKKCRAEVHNAGDAFVESSDSPGLAKNRGTTDAVVEATFIVPTSTDRAAPTPLRIDDPQPKRCNVS